MPDTIGQRRSWSSGSRWLAFLLGPLADNSALPATAKWKIGAIKSFLVFVLVASVVATYSFLSTSRWQPPAVGAGAGAPYLPAAGTHLIAFVMTASDCGWSNHESMKGAFRSIRPMLRSVHGTSYAQVTVIGVALDEDPDIGLRFLAELGNGSVGAAFDQVVVGGRWLNDEVVRFVWRERAADAATPQVVVVERPVIASSWQSDFTMSVDPDRVIGKVSGATDILAWLDRRAPLSNLQPAIKTGVTQ